MNEAVNEEISLIQNRLSTAMCMENVMLFPTNTYVSDVKALLAALQEVEADCDEWKARAEALERAMRGNCDYCVSREILMQDESCVDYTEFDCKYWEFDEARFAEKEAE